MIDVIKTQTGKSALPQKEIGRTETSARTKYFNENEIFSHDKNLECSIAPFVWAVDCLSVHPVRLPVQESDRAEAPPVEFVPVVVAEAAVSQPVVAVVAAELYKSPVAACKQVVDNPAPDDHEQFPPVAVSVR